jgi:hypothetical protein
MPVQPDQTANYRGEASVTILSGASVSSSVYVGGHIITGLLMPAAWSAAGLTFQASRDGVDWLDVYDEDGEVIVASAGASRLIILTKRWLEPVAFIQLRSGTAAAPVNQGAERTIVILTSPLTDF